MNFDKIIIIYINKSNLALAIEYKAMRHDTNKLALIYSRQQSPSGFLYHVCTFVLVVPYVSINPFKAMVNGIIFLYLVLVQINATMGN